jgi:hypothetical protein
MNLRRWSVFIIEEANYTEWQQGRPEHRMPLTNQRRLQVTGVRNQESRSCLPIASN